MTKEHFERIMKSMGFEMKLSGKHWTIKMIGDTRATRLHQLGEQYTGDILTKRIYERKRPVFYDKSKPVVTKYTLKGSLHQVKKLTGFRALYFYYLYLMGIVPKGKPRPPKHPILWEDVQKIEQYSAQITLLCDNKIDTSEQLQVFVDSTKDKMNTLIRQRADIQNKLRRAVLPEVIATLRAEKERVTAEISPLRRNLKLAAGIIENTSRMKERTAMIMRPEREDKQKSMQKSKRKERESIR